MSEIRVVDRNAPSWVARPSLREARGGLASAAVAGRVYAIGGHTTGFATQLGSVEVLRRGTDTWESAPPMLTGRGNAAAAATGGSVYVFGGFDSSGPTASAECFDVSRRTWRSIRRLPEVTSGAGAAALDGRIYLVGGAGPGLVGVRSYDPQTDSYRNEPPLPTGRELLKATVLRGRLYAIGGLDVTGTAVATVERYDPSVGTWVAVAPMRAARGNPGVASAGSRIIAVGGAVPRPSGTPRLLDSGEAFDPRTNSWSPLVARLAVGRGAQCAERRGDELLAFGGFEFRGAAVVASRRVEALDLRSV